MSCRLSIYPEEVTLPEDVIHLSPRSQPYLRNSIATPFSFALCNILDLDYIERQVLLQCPYLGMRLSKMKSILASARTALLNKIADVESEAFG